ncbi:MAG: glutamate formimidoyltransferase [Clostridiales bacterium]|nr:glutamate formimidoyltransferase [Clostridiales bacterium]
MAKIVECVPNFSEGRNQEKIEAIVGEVRKSAGVTLLDYSSDKDHNRSVVTFIGEPQAVLEAAFRLASKAAELINMEEHHGEHPRMGATDVIPFIPVQEMEMSECVALAEQLGEKMGTDLGIPVYLYESAARSQQRRNLADVRRGQYEGFKEKIKDPEWVPDFGPATLHPTAGATAVGAREYLIAYNINLDTANLDIANQIARRVREKGGGLANVKAMGVFLEDRNIAQVSMNLVNYKKTPIYRVFEMVKMEARRYGVNALGSEVIGLVPVDALIESAEYYLQIEDFNKDSQILEKIL